MKNNVFVNERKRLGLTQEQLAKKLNTSRSNVANWENGQNMPSVDLLLKCSSLFDCDVMYLAGYQDNRNDNNKSSIPEPEYDETINNEKNDELNLLTSILKKKGVLNENEDLSEENYNRLIEFAKVNKPFIMKDKDSNK